jgi:5-methylcytosine-specific restriction enzyme B
MSIPSNIKKEHIEQALNEIEISKIPRERHSKNYYLIHNKKQFPPKYVISIANKYINGIELESEDFHAHETKIFLEKLGYNIISKENSGSNPPHIWFVYQGSTFNENQGKKYLWAPLKNKAGGSQFYWDNMLKVKQGDLIFNYSKGIRAISIAKTNCYNAPNPFEDTNWQREGYKVDIDCVEFDKIIKIDQLFKQRNNIDAALIQIKNKPFDRNGRPNQGYLYEFSLEAGRLIRNLLGGTFKNDYIDDIFSGESVTEPLSGTNAPELIEISSFIAKLKDSNLVFNNKTVIRFLASLLTKPFIILSGLSGSGKTKLAQAFIYWICAKENQYKIVPVGADWTNREPLLGYPNALDQTQYIKPDNGVIDLIIHASDNQNLPHFLLLDEMNLSHVERYFADFLSTMESGGKINFHSGEKDKNGVPPSIIIPDNLFIIGTINVDETTYMFSPKVLDRANVIEFRITNTEMEKFLENPLKPNLKELTGQGSEMAEIFMDLARELDFDNTSVDSINKKLIEFFTELKKTGAEFGYRSAYEIHRLINQLTVIDLELTEDEKLDIAIMQKLLPKLHGSRRKLCPVLLTLGVFCVQLDKFKDIEKEIFSVEDFDYTQKAVKFPLSLEKISRMFNGAVDNGFASYAEA